jgi:outer membrane protein assembly factor BamB
MLKSPRYILPAILLVSVLSVRAFSGNEVVSVDHYTDPAISTLIFDASDFLDRLPRDHYITDASRLETDWIFNNTALFMGSRSQYVIEIAIPESGKWHLFARTHGHDNSYFRVAVNDILNDSYLGNRPLNWKHAGTFQLEEGNTTLRLMQIMSGPVLDVLVLTKNENFSEKDLYRHELHPEVELLRSYDIPHAGVVKFGDLTGDNRTDFLVLSRDYSAHAFNHDGELMWSWDAPDEYREQRSEFEAPGLIWDLNRDGSAEAIHWRYMDETEWLVASDGTTGEILWKTEWPTGPLPHVYNNFRLAIGNLDGGYPDNVIAFTDFGGQINVTVYNHQLEKIWQHEEIKQKDHLGHYVYPIDLTGDGRDEIAAGSMLLNADGREIWNRFDLFYNNRDHVDSYRFADLTGNGVKEMVAAHSEVGMVVYDSESGDIVWQQMAEHTQQVETGHFLSGVDGPQVAAGARTYGNRQAGEHYLWAQVQWFSADGELLGLWPEKPINGNPVFVKGDWYGNGGEELFWYKFRMNENGKGELYFSDQVYHMFDFTGNGLEEVITLGQGSLKVYGYRNGEPDSDLKSDYSYLQRNVANHTHY